MTTSATNILPVEAPRTSPRSARSVLRVGYIGLVDAAPLLVAEAFGLFDKRDLKVALSREVGWATIREKICFGELDAAQALCTLPFVSTFGIGSPPVRCVTGLVLSRGGNAIVLSEELRKRGVKNGESLKLDVDNRKAFRKYKFATVYSCSTHNFLLRDWLRASGIDPDADVELVTLPPSQMCRNLAAGTIDGFCAGEPWPSLAISQKVGWAPVCSTDLESGIPEKVLMVRESFAQEHEGEHLALIAALVEACKICEDPGNRSRVAETICDRKKINCPVELVEECLSPTFNYGLGKVLRRPDFLTFAAGDSNRPSSKDADWILSKIRGGCGRGFDLSSEVLGQGVFREDIYVRAIASFGF